MVLGCRSSDATLYVSLDTIKSWYALGFLPSSRNMVADSTLTFGILVQLTKVDCGAPKNPKRFPYSYANRNIAMLPVGP